jgi:hypothetical protein
VLNFAFSSNHIIDDDTHCINQTHDIFEELSPPDRDLLESLVGQEE